MSLYSRAFLSPSFISKLLMQVILPAKLLIDPYEEETYEYFSDTNNKSLIWFNGNAQPASDGYHLLQHHKRQTNILCKNYPGTFGQPGSSNCPDDLFEAGYQNVRAHMHTYNIAASNIVLIGHSLGGGVAAHVANRLHQEGYPVELKIHKSFSSISAVVEDIFEKICQEYISYKYIPLVNGIVICGLSLAAIGILLTGYLASLGLLFKTIENTLGTYPLLSTGMYYSELILGGSITLITALIGSILGCVLGALLSTQLLFTDKPTLIPTRYVISAVLTAACCEIDSISQIKQIINLHPNAKIKIYNSHADQIIPMKASLYQGLPEGLRFQYGEVIRGGHNDLRLSNLLSLSQHPLPIRYNINS